MMIAKYVAFVSCFMMLLNGSKNISVFLIKQSFILVIMHILTHRKFIKAVNAATEESTTTPTPTPTPTPPPPTTTNYLHTTI
jgi:hypothetical protein